VGAASVRDADTEELSSTGLLNVTAHTHSLRLNALSN
jgi:hypothetical protein